MPVEVRFESGPFTSKGSGPGANSLGCAYIYGYDMVEGITYSTGTGTAYIPGDATTFYSVTGYQLSGFPLWLDVETANSWQSGGSGLDMNVADLQGMVDAVKKEAGALVAHIGVYSTSYQWGQITGSPTGTTAGNLSGLPDWIPGARTSSGAASNCLSLSSFTGGAVPITQWFGHPLDGDYSCAG